MPQVPQQDIRVKSKKWAALVIIARHMIRLRGKQNRPTKQKESIVIDHPYNVGIFS